MTDGPQSHPLVTIAIPSYNHESFVVDCINSIIAQDYANIELIIIDDGSRDGSVARIEALTARCRARFARFEFRARDNRGLAATLNEAVNWGKGTYFSLIASDDVLFATKTSTLVADLEQQDDGVAGVFAGACLIDEHGRQIGLLDPPERTYGFEDIVQRRHFLVTPSQLLRLEKVRQVGPLPASLYIEDWYLWLAMTQNGDRLKSSRGALVGYRQHGANISHNAERMLEGRIQILGHFAYSPHVDLGIARCYLMAAMDYSSSAKMRSLRLLGKGVRHSARILQSKSFARLVGKLIVPNAVLRALRTMRSQRRQRAGSA